MADGRLPARPTSVRFGIDATLFDPWQAPSRGDIIPISIINASPCRCCMPVLLWIYLAISHQSGCTTATSNWWVVPFVLLPSLYLQLLLDPATCPRRVRLAFVELSCLNEGNRVHQPVRA